MWHMMKWLLKSFQEQNVQNEKLEKNIYKKIEDKEREKFDL